MGEPLGGDISGPPPFNFKQAIAQMVQRQASDLLLKVGRPPTVRVNGDLQALPMQPIRPEELKHLAEQIMTPRQVKEFAEKKEADFAIGVPGVGRFRTNIYQQRGTLAFALRAIPYEVRRRTARSAACAPPSSMGTRMPYGGTEVITPAST